MANKGDQQQSQSSVLLKSLVSGDRSGGILANDPNGLCLIRLGSIDANNSGVYTNLVRLASKLQPQGEASESAPFITIETDTSATLVKEYDGHAVALCVPLSRSKEAPLANIDTGSS
jgi:hypothetical protein